MQSVNRRMIVGITGVILIGLALIFFLMGAFGSNPSARGGTSLEWQKRIKALGPHAAYAQMADEVKDMSPMLQHEKAHEFGGALYSIEGKGGLSTCDSRFSFGCFHEFLGTAIATEGLAVVDQLNDSCFKNLKESPLSCQHGIGHGVLSFVGYDEAALRQALSICERLPYADPIGGCYGGVFMEFNMRTMLGTEGGTREARHGDLLYPCNAVSKQYANACYFWHAQWLRNTLDPSRDHDISNIYAQVGNICRTAGRDYERPCFEGIGNNLVADADFDAARSRSLCEAAAETDSQELYCKSLAANSLQVGGGGKKGDGIAVCKGLEGAAYTYCVGYANNQSNIAVPADLP